MADMIIKTKRLILRALRMSDADWIARGIAIDPVIQWLTTPPYPYRYEDAVDFLGSFADRAGYFAIEMGGQGLGVITLGENDDGTRDLGYWLAKEAWGKGIMPEAAEALVDWHWARSDAPIISGWILGNARSAQILTQLGFRPTGQDVSHANFHGREMVLERVRLDGPQVPLFTMRTERLKLNALTMDDLDAIHRDYGKPELARMMASVTPNWNKEQAREWLQIRVTPSDDGFGRAVRLHDGTLVGSIGLGGADHILGYMFASEHQGMGLGTEALAAFLRGTLDQFDQMGSFDADIMDDNLASRRLIQKFGFEKVGVGVGLSLGRDERAAATLYRASSNTVEARLNAS